MQFKLIEQEKATALSLSNFTWERSEFSRKFKVVKTSSDFLSIWDQEVKPYLDKETGVFDPPPANSAVANPLSLSHSTFDKNQPDDLSLTPPAKRRKNAEDTHGIDDDDIESCYKGKSAKL